jgi:protein phosphatase
VVAALLEEELLIAHVGDSRGYIVRKGLIKQLTSDHSLVNELVKTGEITSAMAQRHPKKNVLLRSVGVPGEVEVDISVVTTKPNDYVLLCSDGLSNMLSDDEMKQIILQEVSLEEKVRQLIDSANEAGGNDNITVLLIDLEGRQAGGEEE